MLDTLLEFGDFTVIGFLILILGGSGAAVSTYLRPADSDRMRRIEDKLNLILTQLDIDYALPWQELADDPAQKIQAIKAYREHYGTGLIDAKKAVEKYIADRHV